MRRGIDSAVTNVPGGDRGPMRVVVETDGGQLARTASDTARLVDSIRALGADTSFPAVPRGAVVGRLARLALSRKQLEELEAIEELLGDSVRLPEEEVPPILAIARERFDEYRAELARQQQSNVARGIETAGRPQRAGGLARFLRWIDEILKPEGSEFLEEFNQ